MKRQSSQASMVVGSGLVLAWWFAIGSQAQDAASKKDEKPAASAAAQVERMIAELKTIGELVTQLDSDKFETRQKASDKLVEMGLPVREPLRRVLDNQPTLELATRIESILREVAKRDAKDNSKGKELRARLRQPITLENGIDANTPLKDAVEFLAEHASVQIFIDSQAFAAIGVQKVEEQPVQLPKLKNVSLSRVLRLLLSQIKGDIYTGDWLLRPDGIELTTSYHSLSEALGGELGELHNDSAKHPKADRTTRILHIVHIDFERQPVAEALRELADQAAVSVIVDPRVGDKGKTLVTAAFNNVMVDTAVELLADMADLRAVQLDRVFYLTTRENAKAFEAARKPKRVEHPGLNLPVAPPPM